MATSDEACTGAYLGLCEIMATKWDHPKEIREDLQTSAEHKITALGASHTTPLWARSARLEHQGDTTSLR